ncbi:MAG: chemotaxis protein CheA [Candidatus Schekmanbacteria bacterium]|nr:chemotaxis protein CheA [Candidatus Schekmanbacteria bacterium]
MTERADHDWQVDPALIAEFVDESNEMLAMAGRGIVELEADAADARTIGAILRTVHTLKGNAAFFNMLGVRRLAHRLEDLMVLVRDGKIGYTEPIGSVLLRGLDELREMLGRVRRGEEEVRDAEALERQLEGISAAMGAGRAGDVGSLWEALCDACRELDALAEGDGELRSRVEAVGRCVRMLKPHLAIGAADGAAVCDRSPSGRVSEPLVAPGEPALPAAADAAQGDKSAAAERMQKTMRVSEESIDQFLELVGDLVTVGEMLDHVRRRLVSEAGMTKTVVAVGKTHDMFTALSDRLQASILEIRKVPIGNLLNRLPRVLRDLAVQQGKRLRSTLNGSETLIDKSLLEAIEGPLMHLVRNAADHGVEDPAQRCAVGKQPEALVDISVREEDEVIAIAIRDDGRGIDAAAVVSKAIAMGWITREEAARLSQQEVFELLFAPGLSTAEKVTDVSGRGVGMDVVKRNIEEIGGRIEVESTPGKGSAFTLVFPKSVTARIIKGFLVAVDGERYVLPMAVVGESSPVAPECVSRLPGGGYCLLRQGAVLPLIPLAPLVACGNDRGAGVSAGVGVTVELLSQRFILLVDQVLGIQSVVIKQIEGLPGAPELVAGGTILGDERVAIVLDVEALARALVPAAG